MKVAVSASGPDLESAVDPRFGRCQYLTIVDTDSMDFESTPNPAISAPGGAGIQAAQFVVQKGAKAVLTGRCGPNAYQVFQSSGVDVITGVSGTVREAVERFKRGEHPPGPQPGARGGFFRRGYPPPESPTGPGRETVDDLRAEVQQLKERLEKLTQTLEELRREP